MKIVLCDDNDSFVRKMDKKINMYMVSRNIAYSIDHYYSGSELLQSDIDDVDVVFLDIHMPDENGIEVANILRQRNQRFVLVFLSSWIEYATKGYTVKAFRYVLKNEIDSIFESVMEAVFEELRMFQTPIIIPFTDGEKEIYTDDILYIGSDRHIVRFHLINEQEPHHLYDRLDKIQDILPSNEFIRIHKSYLVNLKYFLDAKYNQAELIHDIVLPISQKKYSEIKKQLIRYRGRI